ncbi:MAG: tyrosine-type recombinase/integrase [Mycobacterium sp.]
MTTRRNPGEGGLHWEESRQRWFATVYVGYAPKGKRRKVKVSARTKTEAKAKLQQLLRDRDDGHVLGGQSYTVRDAVESWLAHGLTGRQESTVVNRTILARTHVIPALGARKLAQLSAEEVDQWLAAKAKTLSTDTLHRLLSILRQSIRRAQARDLVKRNVALLCGVPRGTAGRPSKSLTLAQAADLLTAAQRQPAMYAYIVLSLLTGARTEELRALTWSHVDLDGEPPSVQLWRSVREGGDTKTRLSRRTLELPNNCVLALRAHRRWQTQSRMRSTIRRPDNYLVFTTQSGTPLDAANVRRAFRQIAEHAGLHAAEWTPRELRHSFVSLLSSAGIPIEDIAHLVGHANTRTTEKVYRKELRPVLRRGAKAMDDLFNAHRAANEPPTLPPASSENQTER